MIMTSTKKRVQGTVGPSDNRRNNNDRLKKNNESGKKTASYNMNVGDSILTDSELIPVDNEFPYLRKKILRSGIASGSSSSTNSCNSFIFVLKEEADFPEVIEDWETVREREITESIIVNSVKQKYCKPDCKTAWCRLKKTIATKIRSQVFPKIKTG